MISTYPVPCRINATINDHLMLVDITISDTYAPQLVTGLRALLDAKLHCLRLEDVYRDIPITAEGEEIRMDFGERQIAYLFPDQLETLEYYTIDRILELCNPKQRCNLRLRGRNEQSIDVSFRVQTTV